MKVSDCIIHCLENEGVEYVFGIVGKETLDLAESLAKSKQIQFVNVRHEQGAAFMADVYGRLSKKAGVCLSTLGPGATNLLTGISSSKLDHSPLVALIGQASMERHHPESHQYLDIVKLCEPATKWSTQLTDSLNVPAMIRKAFREAKMEKPGSVAVVIPENFLTQKISNKPLSVNPLPENVPVLETLKSAITLIESHMKPFILVGNGVIRQDAAIELQTFINTLQAPVTHSFMAKGILDKAHPANYFTFGFNENDLVLTGMQEADLLIAIGVDFVEQLPQHWNYKKIPVLHIDSLPAEMNEYYPVAIECVGNIQKTLQLLNQMGSPAKPWIPYSNLKEKIMSAYQINDGQQTKTSSTPFTIEDILHCIEDFTTENTIVISDVGAHKVSIARTYQPKKPNRLIISNGLASMGIAIPGSIGAKLACPKDPVICITGDGGALMNFAEIETAKRLGLSFVIIVINDSMLKLEVQQMTKLFGESYGVRFQNPDFVQLAASFGIKGMRVGNMNEFETILIETLHTLDEIVLIEVAMQN
ncbi:acetolactate synthase large subunit [Bacillus benzoevorans]|uniref:Acetolactate synthase-1/2/3 large subunit n=1 Tax=Bacillus benzoevorans TaxID=1456 RepID=A0A7X0HQS1_9BACI|nr:acetolactate synthase large subunit [Bacillus benzoevorans]MBB6444032.1 acetolactate synthase-1/2/3 large subunit [Bacillus benzoevorans]